MKKALLGKKMYDVIDEQEYLRRVNLNPNARKTLIEDTAIIKGDTIFPLLPNMPETAVGMYHCGPVLMYTKPQDSNDTTYSSSHLIDFENNIGGLREIIEKQALYDAAEKSVLISKDNIYNVTVKEDDTPEMQLFKTALNKKSVDIMSYKQRFSSDFSNDIRVIQGDSITFGKLKKLASILDMEVELTIRDKKDAVNPIGEELSTIINE